MKEKWNKYSYLNTDTDCLIEVTHLEGTEEKLLLTPLNNSPYVLMSVEDATIQPTNERNIMEIYGATVTPIVPDTYNPSALVQYKVIKGEDVTYPISKVTDLEWDLEQGRRAGDNYNNLKLKVNELEELLVELYNPNYTKEEVLQQVAELFGFELSKTVTVTGTINFEVNVQVPLDEIDNFDAYYKLGDELSLTSYGNDVEVGDWTIESTDVDWN
jgi:hypothetical protein